MDNINYPNDELSNYRESIDKIDQGIAYLIALRFQLTDAVGALKAKALGIPFGLMSKIYKTHILPTVVDRNLTNYPFSSQNDEASKILNLKETA